MRTVDATNATLGTDGGLLRRFEAAGQEMDIGAVHVGRTDQPTRAAQAGFVVWRLGPQERQKIAQMGFDTVTGGYYSFAWGLHLGPQEALEVSLTPGSPAGEYRTTIDCREADGSEAAQ